MEQNSNATPPEVNIQQSDAPNGATVVKPSAKVAAQAPADGKNAIDYDNYHLEPGKYLIIGLDAQGNEIGDPFTIGKNGYERYYSDATKWKVKKSPLK